MDWIKTLWDLFLHLDKHLGQVIADYGMWTYAILFVIVFCETGLVVTPFLPGDSLLFAAGTFAAKGALNPHWVFLLLAISAVLGDTVNYWIGNYIGPRAFTDHYRFLKKEHLQKAHAFYERHGGKAIILARFVPIIRTFAPFVAGIGAMSYGKFIAYNVAGGVAWVAIFVYGGFKLAETEPFKSHFSLVAVAIVLISVLPMVIGLIRSRYEKPKDLPAA
jgi:membrane-associated protein